MIMLACLCILQASLFYDISIFKLVSSSSTYLIYNTEYTMQYNSPCDPNEFECIYTGSKAYLNDTSISDFISI